MQRLPMLLLLSACGAPPASTGFAAEGGSDAPTEETTRASSTGEIGTSTSSSGSSSSSSTTSTPSSSTGDGLDTTPVVPDAGLDAPGCGGKIDFLFAISTAHSMQPIREKVQAQIAKFIPTIGANFADYNTHIMVLNGSPTWGSVYCKHCQGSCAYGPPEYPCEYLESLEPCDNVSGAGDTYPVGWGTENKRCMVGGNRYIVANAKEQDETLACLTNVGADGGSPLEVVAEVRAALTPEINAPGACNAAFLRPDALLVIIIITEGDEPSDGTPKEWAAEVIARKGGDRDAVVLLAVTADSDLENPECYATELQPKNPLRSWVELMDHAAIGSMCADDWTPVFDKTAQMVLEQCEVFIPQ